MGGLEKYLLITKKACSQSSFQLKSRHSFNAMKNGHNLFEDREMNLLRVTSCLVRACICFFVVGDDILRMACNYSRLASIPRLVTR